ncbi:MAG: protein kinase, partial [Planctomycetes bacterium]|nr:protein kinase [Planctomycetota bacterium]
MPRSRPEELLLAYLDARERDASLTFDAFCAKHPAEADDLRKLFLGWHLAHEKDAKGSLADRMKQRFGSQADPGISLDGGDESTIDQELLDALKARGPSSSRYRLKGEVAQGGMGIILRVWDEDLRRHLAMKVMLDEQEGAASRLSRFLEEAQVTGQLDHPGIVPVHELGIDANGRVYFTMKLVKGKTLAQVFEAVKHGDDGWNVTRALSVVLRVCEAMAFAHEKGVIHRDLKPANIMVGRFGETYVMDWGLARVLGKKDTKDIRPRRQDSVSIVHTSRRESLGGTPNSPLLTMDGDLVGTPVYMPPEQAHGDLERIDARSDVYAVGAILYHLLSGQMPYVEPGTSPAPYTILDRVKAGPPTALHTLVKSAPAELLAICDKAMERDPDRRYASMLDLADDLRAYLERRVVKAYETGAIAEMKKWVHRNKGLAAAAAVALITLAAGATLFVRNTSLKAANAEIANKNEQLARKQDEFDLVAARIKLGNAIAIEETLYPPWPHKIEAMEKWLNGEAAELLALKPTLERTLADLEQRALPWTDAEREADRRSCPEFVEYEPKRRLAEVLDRRDARRAGQDVPFQASVPAELENADLTDLIQYGFRLLPNLGSDPDESAEFASRFEVDSGWDGSPSIDPELALACAEEALARLADDDLPSTRVDALVLYIKSSLACGFESRIRSELAVLVTQLRVENTWDWASRNEAVRGWAGWTGELIRVWSVVSESTPIVVIRNEAALLRDVVDRRRTWNFADQTEHFLHTTLRSILDELPNFELRVESLRRRIAWAKRIEALTLQHPNARVTWAAARDAISRADGIVASSLYRAHPIDLKPQMGLVPIGMNPVTKLWEFYELRSACDVFLGQDPATVEIPAHRPDGSIDVKDETGIVFVLLPGGTFLQGAQNDDPNAPDFDSMASSNESPQSVTLAPFFLARHELTKGQWYRLTEGVEPEEGTERGSQYGDDPYVIGWTHPADSVSWDDCEPLLRRYGIGLPTEAQWEYGARAGTTTPWWTGATESSLRGA